VTAADMTPFVRAIAYMLLRKGMIPASVSLDDVVQAGVLSGLRALDRYDGTRGASQKTFVGHRVVGSIRDEVERQMRPGVEISYDDPDIQIEPAHHATPERHALHYERLMRLARAINRLPARQHSILKMRYQQDRPFVAIAETYGISPARVGQIHAQAVRRLSEAVQ
jgi:RNA polymerase sigma factor (sigma-70 family)